VCLSWTNGRRKELEERERRGKGEDFAFDEVVCGEEGVSCFEVEGEGGERTGCLNCSRKSKEVSTDRRGKLEKGDDSVPVILSFLTSLCVRLKPSAQLQSRSNPPSRAEGRERNAPLTLCCCSALSRLSVSTTAHRSAAVRGSRG
jgi:hypothetical protein